MRDTNIRLRPLEPEDIDFLYEWENDSRFWAFSDTVFPYSRYALKQFVAASGEENLLLNRQMRFVVEAVIEGERHRIGMADLFDIDLINGRAAIGFLIIPRFQRMGFAEKALELLERYASHQLNLHQIYAYIREDNAPCLAMFVKKEYERHALLKDWSREGKNYFSVTLFQKILG